MHARGFGGSQESISSFFGEAVRAKESCNNRNKDMGLKTPRCVFMTHMNIHRGAHSSFCVSQLPHSTKVVGSLPAQASGV